MEAKERSIAYLKQTQKLTIPFFQRAYVWGDDNWEELLDTIERLDEGQFLGSLLFRPIAKTGLQNSLVIDGQQRLTTISILIKALFDTLDETLKIKFENFVREFLFYKINTSDDDFLVKIEHSYLDKIQFETVVKYGFDSNIAPILPVSEEQKLNNKIVSCYYYFKNIFLIKDSTYKKELLNNLSSNLYNVLVIIDLGPSDNEQKIFDTINSAGIKLGCADVVKNVFFQVALELLRMENINDPDIKLINFYKETWEQTFLFKNQNDKETDAYWQEGRTVGRIYKNALEILLYSYAQIKGMFDPSKDKISELADIYKKKVNCFTTFKELEVFVKDVCKYANKYKEKIPVINSTDTFDFRDSKQRIFQILKAIDISVFDPYILQLFIEYENHEEELIRKLYELEIYIMRNFLADISSKNYNKICFELLNNKTFLVNKINEITDYTIIEKMKYIVNKKATLLLFWIELSRRYKTVGMDITELSYTYTLEHIMPQMWHEHWSSIPKKIKDDGSEMNDNESINDRNSKVYWLGNMTLIKGTLNTKLRNYPFADKIEGKGNFKGKGIHGCAELLITKEDLVIPYFDGMTTWDEMRIIERTEKLSIEILSLWPKAGQNAVNFQSRQIAQEQK